MVLIRLFLICLIVFLIVRSFVNWGKEEKLSQPRSEPGNKDPNMKKVSKKIGEYVDYEELDK